MWLDNRFNSFFCSKKAFDVVNHALLFTKLSSIGVRGCLLGWLKDYLSDRKFSVVVHGSQSRQMSVSSGVPQGSVIGPLLFLVYINHVVSHLSCKYCLFADDLKLYLAFLFPSLITYHLICICRMT